MFMIKTVNDIQLTIKEYVTMNEDNIQTAAYTAFRKIIDPEAIRLAFERERDSTRLSSKEMIYGFYRLVGMEIDYDEIFVDFS